MADKDENKMIPIAMGEFMNGMVAPANLFIKLGNGKLVLVFKAGASFDEERLKKYKDKSVSHLWVYATDLLQVSSAAVGMANAGVSQGFLSETKKVFLVSNAAQSIYRSFEEIGIDLTGYEQAKKTSDAVLELAKTDFDIQTLVAMLYEADNYLTSHSIATAILAPAIGQEMGLETPRSLQKLALGGFFHDIGKLQIPPELLNKPVCHMNSDDIKEYQQHCLLGAEMMKSLKLNTSDLMNIVYQHHERNDGSGYPQRLKSHKIHPLAKVVGLASEFLNLVMPNPRLNLNTYTPQEAIELVGGGMGMPFDRMNHAALAKVLERGQTMEEAA